MKIFLQFLAHIAWLGLKKFGMFWFYLGCFALGLPVLLAYLVLFHWWTKPVAKYYLEWKKETYPPGAFREKFGVEQVPTRLDRAIEFVATVSFD